MGALGVDDAVADGVADAGPAGAGLVRGDDAVQVDGMALEFNIEPAHNKLQFVDNVNVVFNTLQKMVPGYRLLMEPAVTFDREVFDAAPPESKVLGCDPDFNGWTGEANAAPNGETTLRTASGHIHIGWTGDVPPFSADHYRLCMRAARQLDFYLGAPSVLWDPKVERRALYGRAGAFRPKPYGVEYRVLSNAWLRSPVLMEWVYDATIKAMHDLWEGDDQAELEDEDISLRVQQSINTGARDDELLYDILAEYVPAYPEV